MWKRAGIWILSAALCLGTGGCSGAEHRKIETKAAKNETSQAQEVDHADGHDGESGDGGEKQTGGTPEDGGKGWMGGTQPDDGKERTDGTQPDVGKDQADGASEDGAAQTAGSEENGSSGGDVPQGSKTENSSAETQESGEKKTMDGTREDGGPAADRLKEPGGGESSADYDDFENADVTGRVLDLTDGGFTMLLIHTVVDEDGSRNSWEAAPGHEKEEDMLNVTYTEDTVFEVMYFSLSQQIVLSRETGSLADLKKQQTVYLWGSSSDGKNWTADRVLIQKWK